MNSFSREFGVVVLAIDTMGAAKGDEDPIAIQAEVATKYYNNLRERSLLGLFLNIVPALLFTGAAGWFYLNVEDHNPFLGQFYSSPQGFILLACMIAAVVCWGLFFWIQVRQAQQRAKLWKDSIKSYEDLIERESKLTTDEEKRIAAREHVKAAQKAAEEEMNE